MSMTLSNKNLHIFPPSKNWEEWCFVKGYKKGRFSEQCLICIDSEIFFPPLYYVASLKRLCIPAK